MAHEVVCPKGHRVQITEAHFGRQVRCPTCNEPFVAPDLGAQEGAAESGEPSASGLPQVDTSGSARRFGSSSRGPGLMGFSLAAGRPLVAIGLLLVLVSRGCDSVGRRGIGRADAKARMARTKFSDKWEEEARRLDQRIEDLYDKEDRTTADDERLAELREQRSKLGEKRRKEEEEFEPTWRKLQNKARDAAANNQMRGWWYEILFVIGTIILTFGLLAVSWNAQGAERWVCLIMLAILTFSIYIGGIAWIPGFPP